MLKVIHKDDGYWLSIDGPKKALINLGEHGPLVTAALEKAAQQGVQSDLAVRCQVMGCKNVGTYSLCGEHANQPNC